VRRNKSARRFAWIGCIAASWGLLFGPAAFAKDPPAQVSDDGLQLQKKTKSRLVYAKPGTTWSQYRKLGIMECVVEFDKNWERDYNNDQLSLSSHVTESDMNRIKKDLGAEFMKVFKRDLQAKGGYEIVDTTGPDVLLVRPVILNLRVTAPDLQSSSVRATAVRSAGSMTLYVELWDSTTKTILARAMDAQADSGTQGVGQRANRVTNTMAADEIFERWADDLRKGLDAARSKPAD
jgi:RNase H-fold protein (predicted Holliday junction resolvase)